MTATLAHSFDVAMPAVGDDLVEQVTREPLRALAGRLAPVVRCGFEVRLSDDDVADVDFQQGVFAIAREPDTLRAHLARIGGPSQLVELVARWRDTSGPLRRHLRELWLEFDRAVDSSPSVFAGLTRTRIPVAERSAVAAEVLELLIGPETWEPWRPAVERCIAACPDGVVVSHLGVMLGRSAPFVRVNVKRLAVEGLQAYLGEVGWTGDAARAVEVMQRLSKQVDGVTVCLDVGERVHEPIGFECHLQGQPAAEPRWAEFLDDLVKAGWCTARNRDALLRWPGVVTPDQGGAWPPHLLRDALLQPPDQFTAIERQLSHVKVALNAGGDPRAKGYFGFLHTWLRPPEEQVEPARPTMRANGKGPLDRAIHFLLESRTSAGWWRDFDGDGEWRGAFGPADVWVSAYVAAMLASTGNPSALATAKEVWSLLAERRSREGGWGYRRFAPPDADTTAWALHLAAAVGRSQSATAAGARRFLERHVLAGGGVATYLEELCPGVRTEPTDGWCRTAHACVTGAAATVATEGGPMLDWLRGAQAGDGSWESYWWHDREYATALAAEALFSTGREDDRERVGAAVEWARGRTREDSAFATALLARILRLGDARAGHESLAASLLERQEPDGGWPADALLRAPSPEVTDPTSQTSGPDSVDTARTFTTATVLSALL